MEKVVMDPSFWKGKSVFLTGHTGFKGSWLSLWLEAMGARVTGYALAPQTEPNLFSIAEVGRSMKSIIADIQDSGRLCDALTESAASVVIHMAAQSLVRESYSDPAGTYATNVMGTVNLLEAVRAAPVVRAVIVVTSDKCYENRERAVGYREDEPMGGYDPYSSSKGCAELVTAAYRRSFFSGGSTGKSTVAVASARAGNVIGGGDWAKDRLVPDTLNAFMAGRRVQIRNPAAIRPWQHVLEPLHGYLTLAERLWRDGTAFAEAWNFGPADEDAKPVSWIVERLARSWGERAGWNFDEMPQPHEAGRLNLDCSKARSRLNWLPQLDLPQALDWIVEWYRACARNDDMRQFTLEQITRYQSEITTS
jgi:CDP-glucose 4,6-dehydratase